MGASIKQKILIITRLVIVLLDVLALCMLFNKLYETEGRELCIIGFDRSKPWDDLEMNTAPCRLGLATIILSILFAMVLMTAESFIGHSPEENLHYISFSLVISSLMALLTFATLVFDAYRTAKSFNSLYPFTDTQKAGGYVFLLSVGFSFLGWVISSVVSMAQRIR
jgi:hypothetical protein